jgi:hypothetical protein
MIKLHTFERWWQAESGDPRKLLLLYSSRPEKQQRADRDFESVDLQNQPNLNKISPTMGLDPQAYDDTAGCQGPFQDSHLYTRRSKPSPALIYISTVEAG